MDLDTIRASDRDKESVNRQLVKETKDKIKQYQNYLKSADEIIDFFIQQ